MRESVVVTIAILWTVASASAETTAIDPSGLSAGQAADLRRSAAEDLKRLADIHKQLAEVRKLRRAGSAYSPRWAISSGLERGRCWCN